MSSLYVFAGLPGVGKTMLARHLARELGAAYLRIDTIEQALRRGDRPPVGPEGYVVAYDVAADNLRLGLSVVADSVNPLRVTRTAWRDVATRAGVSCVEIEVICSDPTEHQTRVESRTTDIVGLRLPTWEDVRTRDYDAWDCDRIVIDTAGRSPSLSTDELMRRIARQG